MVSIDESKADESSTLVQVDDAAPTDGEPALREPEYDVQVRLVDLQADPNNPLYSAKSFEELNLWAGASPSEKILVNEEKNEKEEHATPARIMSKYKLDRF